MGKDLSIGSAKDRPDVLANCRKQDNGFDC